METLIFQPLTLRREGNVTVIRQPIDDDGGFIEVTLSADQEQQVGRFLLQKRQAKTTPVIRTTTHFTDFWQLYPPLRRNDKRGCEAKWARHNLDAEWPEIRDFVMDQLRSKWAEANGQYAPNATTFINQRRWESAADSTPQPQIV
jgi:hypothetical protein